MDKQNIHPEAAGLQAGTPEGPRFTCPTAEEFEMVNRAVSSHDSLVEALSFLVNALNAEPTRAGVLDWIPRAKAQAESVLASLPAPEVSK